MAAEDGKRGPTQEEEQLAGDREEEGDDKHR